MARETDQTKSSEHNSRNYTVTCSSHHIYSASPEGTLSADSGLAGMRTGNHTVVMGDFFDHRRELQNFRIWPVSTTTIIKKERLILPKSTVPCIYAVSWGHCELADRRAAALRARAVNLKVYLLPPGFGLEKFSMR